MMPHCASAPTRRRPSPVMFRARDVAPVHRQRDDDRPDASPLGVFHQAEEHRDALPGRGASAARAPLCLAQHLGGLAEKTELQARVPEQQAADCRRRRNADTGVTARSSSHACRRARGRTDRPQERRDPLGAVVQPPEAADRAGDDVGDRPASRPAEAAVPGPTCIKVAIVARCSRSRRLRRSVPVPVPGSTARIGGKTVFTGMRTPEPAANRCLGRAADWRVDDAGAPS